MRQLVHELRAETSEERRIPGDEDDPATGNPVEETAAEVEGGPEVEEEEDEVDDEDEEEEEDPGFGNSGDNDEDDDSPPSVLAQTGHPVYPQEAADLLAKAKSLPEQIRSWE